MTKFKLYGVRRPRGGGGGGGGGERGEAPRPGTEKRCSHNLQSDPLGSGFKKGSNLQNNDLQHVLCAFYILVPLQNNNVKKINSKFYGERRYSCVFSFLYLNLSTVFVDSLKQNFPFEVFVGVSDRIQCDSVLFGREDNGD